MQPPIVLAGGGLANALLAYRLCQQHPGLPLVLLEGADRLGGNHTWSFHEQDLSAAQHEWLAPFVVHAWPGYRVEFPRLSRRLGSGYRSVTSERLHAVLMRALGPAVRLGARIERIEPTQVWLADGTRLAARAVIDGRGARPSPHLALGWQKFVGQEVRLRAPHGLAEPIVMDATVAQHDGYRFVYVLPFSDDTLLIEDTYYADGAALAPEVLRERIAAYAQARGWVIEQVLREEAGVLPIVLDGDAAAFWDAPDAPAATPGAGGVARSGLGAALFHPTTGYSLPDAVRLADRVAASARLDAPALHALTRGASLAQWRAQRFYRLLNRMLFGAAAPQARYAVLQRFYGLSEPLIARFYAQRLTLADKARILSGRPPVPLGKALRAMRGVPASLSTPGHIAT